MYFFSIIIVSWNALHHLRQFLPSVIKHSPDAEIILADNASDDGSAEWVREKYPEVIIDTLDKNYGYCGGNNRSARKARGNVLLFLNNDVEVTPGWLDPMRKMFDDNSKLAALQPKVLSYTRKDYFEHAGAAGGFLDRHAYPFCRGRIFDHVEKDEGQYDTEKEILWASGAALAIRRDLFMDSGGFDETFEFHMEEIDLCWRLWNQGHIVKLCPHSTVYHLGGGSLETGSPRKIYYNYRNNMAMIIKNSSHFTVLQRVLTRFLLDYLAVLKAMMSFKPKEAQAIVKGQFHFLKDFDRISSQRDELQKLRTNLNDPDTMLNISIVYAYFIKRIRTFRDLPGLNGEK